MTISILCSIGFIPRQILVAESKGTKILSLCEFGKIIIIIIIGDYWWA